MLLACSDLNGEKFGGVCDSDVLKHCGVGPVRVDKRKSTEAANRIEGLRNGFVQGEAVFAAHSDRTNMFYESEVGRLMQTMFTSSAE
jgi:hypothetical protein